MISHINRYNFIEKTEKLNKSNIEKGKGKHLAGPVLDDNVTVLANGSGLLRIGLGCAGVSLGLEVVLFVRHGDGSSSIY